jgi:hypothetical protein
MVTTGNKTKKKIEKSKKSSIAQREREILPCCPQPGVDKIS